MLASLAQFAEIAHQRHAPGQFGTCLGGLPDFTQVTHGLLGSQRRVISLAGLSGQAGHIDHRQLLRLGEFAFLHLDRQRHGDQGEDVEGQRLFNLVFTDAVLRFAGTQHREMRIGQASRLYQFGLADPQVEKRRLQAAIVVERKLNRVIRR